jgi:DNA-binding transcriptional LysR family regulator
MSSRNAKKRYRLPQVGFFQGFEAAARNLSFTKAAEELFLTQSAVSRQIKALEDHIGVALFERRPRSLILTEAGQTLYRVTTDALDRLQHAVDQLGSVGRARQLSVTTSTDFASVWLIPRLPRFTNLHPGVDVRILATTDVLNLERSLVDLAVRYCLPGTVPEGAIRLFGEEILPVCSPALLRNRSRPLERPQQLKDHTLLHFDYPGGAAKWLLDWGTWLSALGLGDLDPVRGLQFSQYEQMIQAAMDGQGVALGRRPLLNDLIQSGALVAPFKHTVVATRAYFLVKSPAANGKPHVHQFVEWLVDEINRDSERYGH